MKNNNFNSITGILGLFMASALALFSASCARPAADSNLIQVVPTYECAGVYVSHDNPGDRCEISFRRQGEKKWQEAYPPVYSPAYKKTDALMRIFAGEEEFLDEKQFRGSLVGLSENTPYEIEARVYKAGTDKIIRKLHASFTTMNSKVPVARKIKLGELFKGEPLVISEKGSPEGWIQITGDVEITLPETPAGQGNKGGTLAFGKGAHRQEWPESGGGENYAAIHLKDAAFIILKDITIKGGNRHGILLEGCENIQVLNCDISGFGRVGKQDLAKDGKYYGPDGKYINNDAGIYILDSGRVLIERCYIHDPRGKANSWRYSHPAGPNSIFPCRPRGEIVVRYNDLIGGDILRWNDNIEGFGNQSPRGSFHRDSDIHGNMFAFANDDGIELDGGQVNIRLYENRFEHSLMAVSTDPCVRGPSYIFRNLSVNLGDEDGISACAIKNSGPGRENSKGTAFYFHNTFCGSSGGMRHFNGVTRNNIFHTPGKEPLAGLNYRGTYYNDFDYDLLFNGSPENIKAAISTNDFEKHAVLQEPLFADAEGYNFSLLPGSPGIAAGEPLPNFSPVTAGKAPDMGAWENKDGFFLPCRPVKLYPDKMRLDLDWAIGKDLAMKTIMVKCVSLDKAGGSFKILKNNDCGWLSVSPSSGVLKAGEDLKFSVGLDSANIPKAGLYKAVFLIKLESGFSIPISVMAKVRHPGVFAMEECEKLVPGGNTVKGAGASGGSCVAFSGQDGKQLDFEFSVPQDGCYFLMMRTKKDRGGPASGTPLTFKCRIDGGGPYTEALRPAKNFAWEKVPGFDAVKLSAGKHTLQLIPEKQVSLDTICVSSEPFAEELK